MYRILISKVDQLQDSSDSLPGNQQYQVKFACSDQPNHIHSVTMTMTIKSDSQTFIEVDFDGVFPASQLGTQLVAECNKNYITFSVALAKKLNATYLLLNNYYEYAGAGGQNWPEMLNTRLNSTYYLQQAGFKSSMLGTLKKARLMIVSDLSEAKYDMLCYVNLLKKYQSAQLANRL